MEAVECGAASLAMVLAYYGLWVPLEQLRQDCGIGRDGSKALNIVKAARNYHMKASGFRWKAESLRDKPWPVILHWEFNHFVVLEGIEGDKVYLNDPAAGHRTVDFKKFCYSYTGIALHMELGEGFKPGGKKYNIRRVLGQKLLADRKATLFISILSLCMVVPGLAIPAISETFLDDVITMRHADWSFNVLLALAFTGIMQAVLVGLRSWGLTRWQTKLTLQDSGRFLWHILHLPSSFFQQRHAGEIASRIVFNLSVADMLTRQAATAVIDTFIAVFYLVLLFQYSVVLTLIGLLFSALNIAVLFKMRSFIMEKSMLMMQENGMLQAITINGLQSIDTLKANGNEADFFAKWSGAQNKMMKESQKIQFISQSVSLLPEFLGGVNMALIMTIGGFQIMDGILSAGTFIAFKMLMGNFSEPVNKLLSLGQGLQRTEMMLKRLDDIYNYPKDDYLYSSAEDTAQKDYFSGELRLENITFGYSKLSAPLLENFNLHLRPGRWVALVGGSGCGKSTVVRLVLGEQRPWEGRILFDGYERKQLHRNLLASGVAAVNQEIFLFSGSVRDNITLFDENITPKDVREAAIDAEIDETIMQLDGGYEAAVSEGGKNFSGGQRQRMELARALVHKPAMLVLDEATSALDPITEKRVLDNIRRRGCSCLIVAHRLSTIRDCDEIIVMDKGRIIQRGTHDELMAQPGLYRALVEN